MGRSERIDTFVMSTCVYFFLPDTIRPGLAEEQSHPGARRCLIQPYTEVDDAV